ncbi:hypothetical protein LCGC14_1311500 [marine sediment metagenome]|uniref:Uncharacterized protein n=1 Tax=marine sediment metagenome TaxID=412755 RepID=A0A0F9KMP7_9ZZZZ
MQIYLVGYLTKKKKSKGVGVFSSEAKAKEHCTSDEHFLVPLTVDETITDDEWADATVFPGPFVPQEEKKSD